MNQQILIVDDEPNILSLFEITLRRHGFSVCKAENAVTALDALRSFTPDLVIVDVMMPGMDGIELCQRIRTLPHTAYTPVLMISALNDPQTIRRGYAAGATDYLTKPTPQSQLLAKIRQLLDQPSRTAREG